MRENLSGVLENGLFKNKNDDNNKLLIASDY